VVIASNQEVDLLFVVDNSGSMAVAQARLAQAIADACSRCSRRRMYGPTIASG
jgi:Mg-chelatase subunit ChlD